MRVLLLITAAAMAVAGTANAQNWAFVTHSNTHAQGMDFESVRISGNRRTAWMVRANAESHPEMGDYSVVRFEFDCAEERLRLLSFNILTFDGASLGALTSPAHWEPVFPDTVSAELMRVICSPLTPPTNGFETAKEFALNARRVFEEDR